MKLKTLIAALSIFAAAALTTACSDKNNSAPAAAAPAPGEQPGKPSVAPDAGDVAEKMDPVVSSAVNGLQQLNSIAGLGFGDKCEAVELSEGEKNNLEGVLKKFTSEKTSMETMEVMAAHLTRYMNKQAESSSYCAVNFSASIANKALNDLVAPYRDMDYYNDENAKNARIRVAYIASFLNPIVEDHLKKIDALETRKEWNAMASENEVLSEEIGQLIADHETVVEAVRSLYTCDAAGGCSDDRRKDENLAGSVVVIAQTAVNQIKDSYGNYKIDGAADPKLFSKNKVLSKYSDELKFRVDIMLRTYKSLGGSNTDDQADENNAISEKVHNEKMAEIRRRAIHGGLLVTAMVNNFSIVS